MEDDTETATRLGPDSTGRWRVTTASGSQQIWDFDRQTYTRCPGIGQPDLGYDSTPVPWTRVDQWPTLGASTLVWFDDPAQPALIEQWRISTPVTEIRRISTPSD